MGQDFGPKSAVLDNQKTAALIDDNSRDLQNIRCIRLVSVLKGGVEPPRPFGHTDLTVRVCLFRHLSLAAYAATYSI